MVATRDQSRLRTELRFEPLWLRDVLAKRGEAGQIEREIRFEGVRPRRFSNLPRPLQRME